MYIVFFFSSKTSIDFGEFPQDIDGISRASFEDIAIGTCPKT